jgi:hypothetical protein
MKKPFKNLNVPVAFAIVLLLAVFIQLTSSVAYGQSSGVRYDDLPDGAAYTVSGRKWNRTNLTYYFQNGTEDIAGNEERLAIRQAFTLWANVSSLTFTEVGSASQADIVILWAVSNHGDGSPFDGTNGVLAHAFYPPSNGTSSGTIEGDAHFDDDEFWTTSVRSDSNQPIDLVTVAAHEIGHSLGLGHSEVPEALMAPYYTGSHRYLAQDDINGIRFLYPLPPPQRRTDSDFNNDGRADQTVFRNGEWYSNLSPNNTFLGVQFGQTGDIPVPADYDGDGQTDHAVVRRANGVSYWYILQSSSGFRAEQWGTDTDKPVPADYDGDGKADIAVFRPETSGAGNWYILGSASNQLITIAFGVATDTPVPGDYDLDGRADAAVTRNVNGNLFWYLNRSSLGFTGFQFGLATDKPVPADYDGDRATDAAVFRNGNWYVQGSLNGFTAVQFGQTGDIPTPADYDGDGRADVAVFRPAGNPSYWYMLFSSNNQFASLAFGAATDIPVTGNPQR